MKEFRGKVAVITGAASGIGRGLAEQCAYEGMKVVLADIQQDALDKAEKEMKDQGATVLAVRTDVSDVASIEALAKTTLESFGAIHLLCNNAGVHAGGSIWELTDADWNWVMGVNLWSVIYGIRIFTPIMLKQEDECHIVNTASLAGLIPARGNGAYCVTKYGVMGLSETLYVELSKRGAKIGVTVLCPVWVKTNMNDSARNRPAELANDHDVDEKKITSPDYQAFISLALKETAKGIPPSEVASLVFEAIREDRLYVIPNGDAYKPILQAKMEAVLQERNPIELLGSSKLR